MIDWNKLAKDIHEQCVEAGWWKPYPNKFDRYEIAMMLVISELSEAMEGHRKNLQDDHLPHHKMFNVEIADAAIRILDSMGATYTYINNDAYNNDIDFVLHLVSKHFPTMEYKWPTNVPDQLYFACQCAAIGDYSAALSSTLAVVIKIAKEHEIDLPALIEEKREYNRQRADHKEEVRNNDEHGKKF